MKRAAGVVPGVLLGTASKRPLLQPQGLLHHLQAASCRGRGAATTTTAAAAPPPRPPSEEQQKHYAPPVVPLRFYFDYKSPFSYLAKDEIYALEQEFAPHLRVEWLPFAFDVEHSFGLPQSRTTLHWNKVKYAYLDARRFANARSPPVTLKGPKRVFDSSLAMMAGLYCLQYDQQQRGSLNPPLPSAPKEDPKRTTTFRCYTDVVFERFFKHELDLEDLSSLKQILLLARNESDQHQLNDETGVEEWVEQGFEDFALKAEENGLSKGGRALERIRRQAVEEEGVFGVPSMVAGGELFFGNDRIDWLRRKLQQQLLALRC